MFPVQFPALNDKHSLFRLNSPYSCPDALVVVVNFPPWRRWEKYVTPTNRRRRRRRRRRPTNNANNPVTCVLSVHRKDRHAQVQGPSYRRSGKTVWNLILVVPPKPDERAHERDMCTNRVSRYCCMRRALCAPADELSRVYGKKTCSRDVLVCTVLPRFW